MFPLSKLNLSLIAFLVSFSQKDRSLPSPCIWPSKRRKITEPRITERQVLFKPNYINHLEGYHFLWKGGCHEYPKVLRQYLCDPSPSLDDQSFYDLSGVRVVLHL